MTTHTNGASAADYEADLDGLYSFWPGLTPAPPALPEAPASVNVHITIAGRQVQLTLRDADEGRLLQRLQAVLQQYPAPAKPPASQAPQGEADGYCAIHETAMKLNVRDGHSWFSHRRDDGSWCKGKGR